MSSARTRRPAVRSASSKRPRPAPAASAVFGDSVSATKATERPCSSALAKTRIACCANSRAFAAPRLPPFPSGERRKARIAADMLARRVMVSRRRARSSPARAAAIASSPSLAARRSRRSSSADRMTTGSRRCSRWRRNARASAIRRSFSSAGMNTAPSKLL